MPITQEQFNVLVEKLEDFSKTHPRSYRFRVALFALLGYAYIFLVLAGLLTLIGLVVSLVVFSRHVSVNSIKLIILLLIPACVILRSLGVSFPPPQGLRISRHEAPRLFVLVDELTTKLQAPRFHNILLNQELNAAVVQVPQLGILGWQENYLLLGLPLMQSLSLEQFKAVLAHELGHLSGNHSRFSAWIYRIRKTWMQIYTQLNQIDQHKASSWVGGSSVLFNRFLDWYWPAFDAYSFILARMNEYEADRCAAQLTGDHNAAEALINVQVKTYFLESIFWPKIEQQVEHLADPPSNTYSSMLTILHRPISDEQTKQWLEQALAQKTSYVDTHPCLADRLKSLGYSTSQPQILPQSLTIQTSAAENLLGDTLHEFAMQFDEDWQADASAHWRQRYAYLQEVNGKLQALEQKAKMQALTAQEAWERAYYVLKLKGDEASFRFLKEVLKIQPDHAAANYTIGQILLKKDYDLGIIYVKKAIVKETDWIVDGCKLVYDFLWRQGRKKEAQKYHNRAEKYYQISLKAQQERACVGANDRLKPHTLKASEVSQLKQQLASYSQIKEAYLVEKVLTYFPEKRFCILGIVRKRGLIESLNSSQKLIKSIIADLEFLTQIYVIVLNYDNTRKLKEKIKKIDQALIFRC